MKTETVILVIGVGVIALGAYYLYQKKNSQLNLGRNGITGTLNINQLASAAGSLLGGVENLFGGGSGSNTFNPYGSDTSGYGTYDSLTGQYF